ncbi:ABC transporter ATP-binding protein [Anaerosalibacter sp. Marseille-P3206]|uniref:ABC transporter ATP-binding protein n=1 Tax=Anaerosalibacter sp. Marseille-P3206 TaxID=1871005 RepID=UPI001F2D2A87|nr:ABC transporter ATP-binding protein [Anaerosalibacter sp. Marseille-P3206]
MEKKKVVEIKNICMNYHTLKGETEAIKDVNLDIYKGEIVTLVGPSGCGKSTLLSIIAGLIKPTKGEVLINGKKATKTASDIGYMFQRDHLFEWRNILQNVLIGLEIQGKVNEDSLKYAEELLETYGLGEFKNSFPRQLSGGMRQRVALIRTLVIKPDLLLLDEPFSALDYQTRLAIADEIGVILKKEKKTALMVTHDIAEAISMADRVVVLSKRPGTIKDIISIELSCPEDIRTPMKCREAPEFRHYFNKIWKELDVHV